MLHLISEVKPFLDSLCIALKFVNLSKIRERLLFMAGVGTEKKVLSS